MARDGPFTLSNAEKELRMQARSVLENGKTGEIPFMESLIFGSEHSSVNLLLR